jgi:hypothetical protein
MLIGMNIFDWRTFALLRDLLRKGSGVSEIYSRFPRIVSNCLHFRPFPHSFLGSILNKALSAASQDGLWAPPLPVLLPAIGTLTSVWRGGETTVRQYTESSRHPCSGVARLDEWTRECHFLPNPSQGSVSFSDLVAGVVGPTYGSGEEQVSTG